MMTRRRKPRVRVWAAAVVPASALVIASGAGAAGTSGPIEFYVSGTTVTTPILVTGVVTDYGKATSVTRSGKPDENGNYERVVLQKGGFWVDATQLNKKLNSGVPRLDRTRCSFTFRGTGPTKLFRGTGAYAGISGAVDVTVTFVGVLPKLKDGKCDMSQSAQPVAQFGVVTGSGTASY
jgi:hypothetical protein